MEKFTVYDFKGVPHQSWNGEHRVQKMTLKECFDKVFSAPYSQRNMKQLWECLYCYDITKLSVEDIRDLVGKGYVFIPFAANVDKNDVLRYIKIGLKPLFMKCKDYNSMKKAYKEIA